MPFESENILNFARLQSHAYLQSYAFMKPNPKWLNLRIPNLLGGNKWIYY